MKKINVQDAVGQALCHDVTAITDGFKGALYKRGHVLTEEDIPRLLDIGKKTVFVWEPDAGEVHEEDAALRFAAVNPVEGVSYEGPSEGKVVLRAKRRGMLRVDTELQRRINSIGDITVTSLPDHYPVEENDRVASMRIVPLVTKEEQITEMEALCKERPLFRLLPYRQLKAGVIITGSELYHGRITDRFEPVARKKLAAYPCEILGVEICDDDLDMIAGAARRFLSEGALLLVFSGGMSVDPDDLTPGAIRSLGAEVVTQGVPAQPGNMTLIAYLGEAALVGVPSAAISSPATMFDVVLPQLFTGERFTKAELVNLGNGGLCQQCKSCHYPNCTYGKY